jgi:hypothetical protein
MSEEFNFDFNDNKIRRLEGAGHLVRMSVAMTVKKVFLGQPDGRRKAGIQELRWLDCVENELKLMGAKTGGRKLKTDPYGPSF